MMISGQVSIAAVLGIAAILAAPATQSRPAAPTQMEQAVLARMAEIQRAAEALDPDKVFSFVLENDTGSVAQNGKLLLTRKEALESTQRGFRGLARLTYTFDQQYVTMLSPTTALVTGEGSSTATLDDGRTLTNRFAKSVVLALTAGEWKVLHAHRSFAPPS